MDTMTVRTPWHLWVVGVVSLLWNGFGAYDYLMSMTQRETYWRASGMTQAMIDYYNAMPTWMYVPWTLGVWGAVAGSLLLLVRSRWALWGFALSLVGAVISLGYGLMNPMPPLPAGMEMMKYMSYVIVVIAALLLLYARTMRRKGVLR